MRIARILTRLNLGGPARQVLASDPILGARGHTIRVFAGAAEPGEGSLDEELRLAGVDVRSVPGLRRGPLAALDGGDRRAKAFLRRELREFAPDIVHTHASKAGALGRSAALACVPAAKRVHTFHGHVLEGYFPAPLSRFLVMVERRLAAQTHQILAVSEATKADLVRLRVVPSGDAIRVVHPGTQLEELLAMPMDRPTCPLRRELSIPPDAVVIGLVGRLAEVKRPVMALRVFEGVAREFPAAHLLVAGDGALREALERELARMDASTASRVHLLGAVARIGRVHEALDVLLGTSTSEGMPVAMIEAAATGRPVVSTAVGGVPELVTAGVTGLFGTDRDALVAALSALLGDPEERWRLGAAARERAAREFTADALANKLEAVYRSLLASVA